MAEYNSDDLIGRTFLLPPNHKGERHRASIKQKVIKVSQKLDADQETMAENINFLLDVGQGDHSPLYHTTKCSISWKKTPRMKRPYSSSGP